MSNAPRFVVIDDDAIANMITARLIKLHLRDASTETFTDARMALDAMSGKTETEQQRTIVFLDINMPGLINGWQFLDAFTAMGDCVSDRYRVYMLSSSIDPRDKELAGTYPCVAGMLGKPLTPENIKGILENEYAGL